MSIATQTPEAFAYSPLEEDRLLTEGQIDRAKMDTSLSKIGLAGTNILPHAGGQEAELAEPTSLNQESAPLERISLLPTFILFQDIQEAIADSDRVIAGLRQDLTVKQDAIRSCGEYLEEVHTLEAEGIISADQVLNSVRNTKARIKELADDELTIERQIKAEENSQAKLQAWLAGIGDKLAKMEDPSYLKAATPANAHPYSAGSLSRTDGTVADRTPH